MKKIYISVFFIFLFSILFLLKIKTVEAAGTLYADINLSSNCTSGNYSIANRNCTGTNGNAYKMVKDAIAAAAVGDTLLVRGGTYREIVIQSTSPVRSSSFEFNKSMTIKGYSSETATLTYDPNNLPHEDAEKGPIIKVPASGVTIENLTIIGTYSLGDNPTLDTDINIWTDSANITIRNNKILQFGHCGVKGTLPGLILEHNEIANGGFTSRDHGIYTYDQTATPKIIRYNNFHNIGGYGIQIYGYCTYYQVYNNLIHDNNEGGIVIAGDHISILNNSIYHNGQTSTSQWGGQGRLNFFHTGLFSIVVKNNIIWNNAAANLNTGPDNLTQVGNIYANNIIGGTLPNWWTSLATNTIAVDPKFVNAPAFDYHLQSTSPAINTGVNVGLTVDYAGTTIPQGSAPDIGAYEFIIGGTPVPTPATTPVPTPTPLPGDLNNDGKVDGIDYVLALLGNGDINIVISNISK